MYEFESLRNNGAAVAAMSDRGDGDCGWHGDNSGTRARFLYAAGAAPENLVVLRQIHSRRIEIAGPDRPGAPGAPPGTTLGEGDGLITSTPGLALGITVADCVPVLLHDSVRGVAAAIHAGRVGTAAGISAAGLARMVADFGVEPGNVRACIGPSAGPCCYEVSEEIRADWEKSGLVARGRNLDLWASNAAQLRAGGMKDGHISMSGHCTICSETFHSFRREGTGARNLAVIML